ncbi:MAG: amidohydrolase family protein [Anaerolineae bacterium]|nr:amidohydrolase family protein [Anaerolineae bacterium]
MLLEAYRPQSKLQVPATSIERPRFPVIDAHNHVGSIFGGDWLARPVGEFLAILDAAGARVFVDLDGGWGESLLQRHLEHFKAAAPDRFVHFGGVNWSRWPELGQRFPEWAAVRLREQVRWGAQGLKIWKQFGLEVRDSNGYLAPVDDPRLDPLWASAAELGIPVLIHVADPAAFFDSLDARNERWEELHAHPDWHFPSPPYPAFETLVEQLANLVLRHPNTTFIGAHVGCYAENLAWVAALLDRAPNFYVDISARISELGRQPYTARRFFLDYADRILFGTDMGPDLETYRLYYRFLESADEYFDYGTGEMPAQGRWRIYGLNLPDDVLERVYARNAASLLGIKGVLS